jgi:hypothetical protein
MNKDYINYLKQQVITELQHYIGMPNNKEIQRQIVQTIQDIIIRLNAEGHHITVDADLMYRLNDVDIRLTLVIMKEFPDCGFEIISFCIR